MNRLLVLLLAVPAYAHADHDAVLVVGRDGYYLLATDHTTTPPTTRLTPIGQVIILDGPGPGPTPTPGPILTERAKAVRDATARAVTDAKQAENATAVAMLYTEIAKQVRAGKLKGSDVIAFACKYGCDKVLEGQPATAQAAWLPMRNVLSGYWTSVTQEGGTDAAFAALLDEASAGITAAVPKSQAGALDLQKIIQIIKVILDLILQLFPTSPLAPPPPQPIQAPAVAPQIPGRSLVPFAVPRSK